MAKAMLAPLLLVLALLLLVLAEGARSRLAGQLHSLRPLP